MEYMNIGGFLGRSIEKIINKMIEKKLNINPKIEIETIKMFDTKPEDKYKINLSLLISRDGFEKIIEKTIE